MPKLHIVCLREGGMNRAGLRHDGHQVHELGAFTVAQLREMHDDPNLVLIIGGDALTEEQVAAAEKAEAEKAAAEKAEADRAKKSKG